MKSTTGKLISIIGIDSVLKSLHLEQLPTLLKSKGYNVALVKYPMYDCQPTGSYINSYIRGNNPDNLSPEDFQRLCAENRRDYEPKLSKLLLDNDFVLCDLYTESGIVYGDFEGVPIDKLLDMNKDLIPADLVLVCNGSPANRIDANQHRFEGGANSEILRERHLQSAENFGWRIIPKDQDIFLEIEGWLNTISQLNRA